MRPGYQVGHVVPRDAVDCIRLFYPQMSQVEALEHIGLVGEEVIPEMHRL